jgi:hypothetical protein
MPQRWCQWCVCAVTARHNPAEATAIRGFHRPTSITPRPRSSSPVESHVLAPILRSSHAGCDDLSPGDDDERLDKVNELFREDVGDA